MLIRETECGRKENRRILLTLSTPIAGILHSGEGLFVASLICNRLPLKINFMDISFNKQNTTSSETGHSAFTLDIK
jgi:hypothetical protein